MSNENKTQILQRVSAIITALNAVNVSGKQNLANLYGSIAALEELIPEIDKVIPNEPEIKQE